MISSNLSEYHMLEDIESRVRSCLEYELSIWLATVGNRMLDYKYALLLVLRQVMMASSGTCVFPEHYFQAILQLEALLPSFFAASKSLGVS